MQTVQSAPARFIWLGGEGKFFRASDLDFVVSFSAEEPHEYARCYFSLAEALEKLFRRHADLVTERSIRNPYFREEIELTRQPIYGA